ncbi:MAG: response regulator transcription factor [Firmicutes bacterium]|nr:response regulator transcription factor [Bacillota bacterium]
MNTGTSEKILVVDDDIQIQKAIRIALSARGYEVMLASSGEEALETALLKKPDLVILDLSLPQMSGFEFCREFRRWSEAPVIVLSIRDRESDKISALDLGADDYITKPFNTAELLARIRAHLRRSKQASVIEDEFEFDELKVNFPGCRVVVNDVEVKLTKTEFALLQYFIKNAGRVVTYNNLLSHVWGPEYECDTQTLRVHIGNLRKKIEPDSNRPKFIITEPGVGYRFTPSFTSQS